MISHNFLKFVIFIVILHRTHQFNIAESFFYHFKFLPISNETFLTDCQLYRDPMEAIDVDHLLFRCTWDTSKDITRGVRDNATTLHCINELMINVQDVNMVKFENCSFPSFPHQLLHNFKHISVLDMTGLSLEVLRNGDIPILASGELGMPSLDLSNNNITRINNGVFYDQENIEVLSFNKNRLRFLNGKMFTGLFGLNSLNFAENEIVEVSPRTFYEMPKLRRLNLNGNRIETIGDFWFNEINKLRKLDLSDNHINKFNRSSFARLHHLKELNLSGNRIFKIAEKSFEWLLELEKLFLRDNRIRRMDGLWFGEPNSLTHLILSYNSIAELNSSDFVNLPQLKYLDLENNGLVEVPKGAFVDLQRLEELDLDHNHIRSICYTWFSANNSLWKLNLSYNKFTALEKGFFVRLANLTELDVSHSMVANIEAGLFVPHEKLQTLDLSHNRLRYINITALFAPAQRSMRYLNLDSNQLTQHLEVNEIRAALPRLMDVSIENNRFACKYLRKLDAEVDKRKGSTRYHTDFERSCSERIS